MLMSYKGLAFPEVFLYIIKKIDNGVRFSLLVVLRVFLSLRKQASIG